MISELEGMAATKLPKVKEKANLSEIFGVVIRSFKREGKKLHACSEP